MGDVSEWPQNKHNDFTNVKKGNILMPVFLNKTGRLLNDRTHSEELVFSSAIVKKSPTKLAN